jgi:hypothetical protein
VQVGGAKKRFKTRWDEAQSLENEMPSGSAEKSLEAGRGEDNVEKKKAILEKIKALEINMCKKITSSMKVRYLGNTCLILTGSETYEVRMRNKMILCKDFMAGNCLYNAQSCRFSHDSTKTRLDELCRFYIKDRCFKDRFCLYMHKGFPCQFYHTNCCVFAEEVCKFSHEPLNEMTRKILLEVTIVLTYYFILFLKFISCSVTAFH